MTRSTPRNRTRTTCGPWKNEVLNQIYANVLGRPVLVPSKSVVSLGSAIFAFLEAGTFKTVEEAQATICSPHKMYLPDSREQEIYEGLYAAYRKLYFAFGDPSESMGDVLPTLIRTAESVRHEPVSPTLVS